MNSKRRVFAADGGGGGGAGGGGGGAADGAHVRDVRRPLRRGVG